MAVKSFKVAMDAPPMMDDQKVLMTVTPLEADGVTPGTLPTGVIPTYAASPGTAATLDPTVDPTGLSCMVLGVKGLAGTETITVSATLPDASVITGSGNVTTTIDPTELEPKSFGVAFGTPVAQ